MNIFCYLWKNSAVMKKMLILIVACCLLTGCSLFYVFKKDYRNVTNYTERMELLQSNFPEIYSLYLRGAVILDDMFTYTGKDGGTKVHIEYHYR